MSFATRFVRHPERFPSTHHGERAGSERLYIELPGCHFAFRGLSKPQSEGLRERFSDFVSTAHRGASFEIEVFHADARDFCEIDTRRWDYTLDFDHSSDSVRLAGLKFMARIDWHPRPSAAIWTSEPCGPAFAEVVENVFRPLVAYHLAASGGALVHSCAVEVAGRCAILFGHADAGKSTIARLALERGMRILSDDLNAIVCAGGEWIVRAMPFAGEHRGGDNGESIPLGALFKIVKSTENRVNSLRPAEGLASLFACAPYVNIDPHRGQALEATLASMVTSVSLGVLEFHRDGGFWPLLESAGGSLAEARDRHGRR